MSITISLAGATIVVKTLKGIETDVSVDGENVTIRICRAVETVDSKTAVELKKDEVEEKKDFEDVCGPHDKHHKGCICEKRGQCLCGACCATRHMKQDRVDRFDPSWSPYKRHIGGPISVVKKSDRAESVEINRLDSEDLSEDVSFDKETKEPIKSNNGKDGNDLLHGETGGYTYLNIREAEDYVHDGFQEDMIFKDEYGNKLDIGYYFNKKGLINWKKMFAHGLESIQIKTDVLLENVE